MPLEMKKTKCERRRKEGSTLFLVGSWVEINGVGFMGRDQCSIWLHRNNVCFQKTKSNPMLSKVITQAGCGGVIRDVLSNSVQVELDAKFVIDIFSNMKNINGPPNSLLDDCRGK
ncbi:hypothetical protein CFP56_022887 [Quercus suber]|uniref:Uncharacterized protein n=1 Tax=Quercus suber TaxID=58331 RepID=A0AAW0KA17_QUESU